MTRPDMTDKLIHFTGPSSDAGRAQGALLKILAEKQLNGGTGMIKGGHQCVCFTEAPLTSLPGGLVNPSSYSRYSPYGIMFEKKHIFSLGGRPVVYQSDAEYAALPQSLQWRHVRYEPDAHSPVDFTWEREWRFKTATLAFKPTDVAIIVPDTAFAEYLQDQHSMEQEALVEMYSMMIDSSLAEHYREDFPWRIVPLKP